MRWLPIVLGTALLVSLAGNAVLGYAVLNDAVGHSYADQIRREIGRERQALAELRRAFCPDGADATAINAWAQARGQRPFEKDGFTWVGDVAVHFDGAGRADGVCQPSTWQSVESDWSRELSECPPEPLC